MLYVCFFTAILSLQNETKDIDLSGNKTMLQALLSAYEDNRNNFPIGHVNFRLIKGDFSNETESRNPSFSGNHTAQCKYIFSKNNAFIAQIFSNESMAATTVQISNTRSSSQLKSFRKLTNGKLTFNNAIAYSVSSKSSIDGNIISAGSDEFYNFAFPLSIGYPETSRDDFGRNLSMAIEGGSDATIKSLRENVLVDGISTIEATLVFKNGTRTFWLDLERGMIPLRIQDDLGNNTFIDTYYDDLRLLAGHGWLPFSQTIVHHRKFVSKIVLEQVDFTTEPKLDEFCLNFTELTSVANSADGRSYAPRKSWNLNQLSSYSSQVNPMVRSGGEPQLPGVLKNPPLDYSKLLAVLAFFVLLVVLSILFLQNRSAKR